MRVLVDEDRAVYAAWGLGLGSMWYVLHPASQAAGFREKGWLGATIAGSLQVRQQQRGRKKGGAGGEGESDGSRDADDGGPVTTMGNKWQEAGAWAVDGRGRIVWGGKAARADDVMDLDAGVRALGIA